MLNDSLQMIPPSMKYNAEGSTPSFSEADGMTVERGSQVRLRIKGIRGELGQMFAIGSIREDYLGYAVCYVACSGMTNANTANLQSAATIVEHYGNMTLLIYYGKQ